MTGFGYTPGRSSLPVWLAPVAAALAFMVTACGLLLVAGSGGGDTATSGPAGGPTVLVRDAWTTAGQSQPAVYLTIENHGGDDALVGASAAGAGAASVVLMGGDVDMAAGGGVRHDPALRMAVPRGTTVLRPGGPHLMLLGTTAPAAGARLTIQLELERAGPVEADVEVVTPEAAAARSP
jgi:copper(I)-binding protein